MKKHLELQITQTRLPKSVGDRQMDQLGPLLELRFARVMQVFIWGEMFLRKKRTILLTAHIVTGS